MTEQKRDIQDDLKMCWAATTGPWYATTNNICSEVTTDLNGSSLEWVCQLWYKDEENMQNHAANARFIAEARTALPHYIKRTQEAEAEVERLRNFLTAIKTMCAGLPSGTTAGEVYKMAQNALSKD